MAPCRRGPTTTRAAGLGSLYGASVCYALIEGLPEYQGTCNKCRGPNRPQATNLGVGGSSPSGRAKFLLESQGLSGEPLVFGALAQGRVPRYSPHLPMTAPGTVPWWLGRWG